MIGKDINKKNVKYQKANEKDTELLIELYNKAFLSD